MLNASHLAKVLGEGVAHTFALVRRRVFVSDDLQSNELENMSRIDLNLLFALSSPCIVRTK